jgi:hypothetical protein
MSGTIMKHSLKDFTHLLAWSHRQGSPLPLAKDVATEWAEALDEGLNCMQHRSPGELLTIMPGEDGGEGSDEERARRIFQVRLERTPGVVIADSADDYTGSLLISAAEYTPNRKTEENFEILRTQMTRPDGWALSEAMQVWAEARRLALGLHYTWDPLPPESWLQARKNWAKFVRDFLSSPKSERLGIDSEFQTMNEVLKGHVEDEYGTLEAWRRLRPTFAVNSCPVWHDDTALKACTTWLEGHPKGIVWVEHRFFGDALARMSGRSYFREQGLDAKGAFIEDADGPIIASIAANSTGRNLQHKWCDNLITAPAADSERWEQLLGRTFRKGQVEDTVTAEVLVGCKEHAESIPRALSSADVKKDLLGFSQVIRLADVDWPDFKGQTGFRWG